jgi:hypothetical protein
MLSVTRKNVRCAFWPDSIALCAEVVVGSMVLAVIFSPWCCGSPPIGGPTAQRTRRATIIRTVAIGLGVWQVHPTLEPHAPMTAFPAFDANGEPLTRIGRYRQLPMALFPAHDG